MLKQSLVVVITAVIVQGVCAVTFDPGCSFSNGQCSYTVTLGHQQHCDRTTRVTDSNIGASSTPTGTGFQSCSCKDLDGLSQNVHSLSSGMTSLQNNFDTLAKSVNVTQEHLNVKTAELLTLQGHHTNLTALLADRDMLLTQSKADLVNIATRTSSELDQLRKQLTDSNNNLAICKATLHILDSNSSHPALYGGFHTNYCDFEDARFCGYTTSSSSSSHVTEVWHQGTGSQNSISGPVDDHSFGTPKGHYMYIDPYRYAPYGTSTSGHVRKARLQSPEFPPASSYCLRFWYTLYGPDIGDFSVYAKVANSLAPRPEVGSGDGYAVWSHHGQQDKYWHMAQISLDSEYTSSPFRVVFEGTTSSYQRNEHVGSTYSRVVHNGYGYIAVDDVYVYNTTCSSIPTCPAGSRKMMAGNHTSCLTFHLSPASWYDAVTQCKLESPSSHLVRVYNQVTQDFLVDVIQNDAALSTAGNYGYYTSGNDEHIEGDFVWTNTGYPDPVNFTDWRAGQPNNVGNKQQCLLLQYPDTRFQWGDVDCSEKHPYICEMGL